VRRRSHEPSRSASPVPYAAGYRYGDPNIPPPAGAWNLLGLTGVINQIRLCFDGTTSALAPWGILVVEKL
jgi:hypothetical protein